MVLECAEEQKSALRRILHVAIEHVASDSSEDFLRLDVRLQPLFETLLNFIRRAFGAEYFPIEIVFRSKVAKDHRLGDAGSICDLTCRHTIEAVTAE